MTSLDRSWRLSPRCARASDRCAGYPRADDGGAVKARSSSDLPIRRELAWTLLNRTAVQLYLSRGFFSYGEVDELPSRREQGYEAHLRLKLFGWLPVWVHHQRFTRVDPEEHEILVEERGGPYGQWDHVMRVVAAPNERSTYVDEIEVGAGWRTPLVGLFAWLLCRKRATRFAELARLLVD